MRRPTGSRTPRPPGPAGGAERAAGRVAAPSSVVPRPPPGPGRPVSTSPWSRARRWSRPGRAGTMRAAATARPRSRRARLPVRAVRKPTAPTADTARSALVIDAVPKSRLGERSTRIQVSSSRSAMDSRTWVSIGAGGHVPVDAADVVAGHVGAGLAGLGAVTGHEPAVVALQQAVEAAGHGQLEATQDLGRTATRIAGRGHRQKPDPVALEPGSAVGRAPATAGAGTVDSSRARTWSTSTPWARAS